MPIGPLLAAASDAAARTRERRGDVTPTGRIRTCISYPTRGWPPSPILRAITPSCACRCCFPTRRARPPDPQARGPLLLLLFNTTLADTPNPQARESQSPWTEHGGVADTARANATVLTQAVNFRGLPSAVFPWCWCGMKERRAESGERPPRARCVEQLQPAERRVPRSDRPSRYRLRPTKVPLKKYSAFRGGG